MEKWTRNKKAVIKGQKLLKSVQKFISHFDEQENLSKPKANMSLHKVNKKQFLLEIALGDFLVLKDFLCHTYAI